MATGFGQAPAVPPRSCDSRTRGLGAGRVFSG